jgi:transcriptional regulator with XRE-family HTH domain
MKHTRRDIYREERATGMTYREIAEKHGVSYQAVADALGKSDLAKFKPWTEKRCIYPNLRHWLNENKVSLREFARRSEVVASGRTLNRFGAYFRGENYPPKQTIDKILNVTGLTYEQLWEVEDA